MPGVLIFTLVFDPHESTLKIRLFIAIITKSESSDRFQLKINKWSCTITHDETVRHFEPSELMYSLQHATYLMGLAADNFMQETTADNENNYWMTLHLCW